MLKRLNLAVLALLFSQLLTLQAAYSSTRVAALALPHKIPANVILNNKIGANSGSQHGRRRHKAGASAVSIKRTGKASKNVASARAKRKQTAQLASNAKLKKVADKMPALPKLSAAARNAIIEKFTNGQASNLAPGQLVAAGVFSAYPLKGGTFRRRSEVQNLIIHSTETGSVADAKQIIRSWNNGGPNHAGTQYIVDRDGVIYQTVNPQVATYHVNSYKTLEGVKNDNSIGIEIVRTGSQQYTAKQLHSVVQLAGYLKEHFHIAHVWGHGQIQPSDRTDPVAFDWTAFNTSLANIGQSNQIASRKSLHDKT